MKKGDRFVKWTREMSASRNITKWAKALIKHIPSGGVTYDNK